MTLEELKKSILKNTVPDDFIIFQCEENYFLAEQYVNAISKSSGLTKKACTSIFTKYLSVERQLRKKFLYIIRTDTFAEPAQDYSKFTNTIVICNKVDKHLKQILSQNIITIPKLLDWQIVAYIQQVCPCITEEEALWLYHASNDNIYFVEQELQRLSLFSDEADQHDLFMVMRYSRNSPLYNTTAFKLAEAIAKRDIDAVFDYFWHAEGFSLEPMQLIGALFMTFKQILYVIYGDAAYRAADLGLSSWQINNTKSLFAPKICPEPYVKFALHFVSELDYRTRSGKLDLPKQQIIDYIISTLMSYK